MNPLVIGIGNRLRQDDGMGCRAAELLAQRFPPETIRIEECHQLTPEWADAVADAPLVVFLDAAVDQPPGSVDCRRVYGQPDAHFRPGLSHHLAPSEVLSLASVETCTPVAFLISGGAFEIGFEDRMTEGGERCAEQMAAAAERILLRRNMRSGSEE